jgi:hypothetical protein
MLVDVPWGAAFIVSVRPSAVVAAPLPETFISLVASTTPY